MKNSEINQGLGVGLVTVQGVSVGRVTSQSSNVPAMTMWERAAPFVEDVARLLEEEPPLPSWNWDNNATTRQRILMGRVNLITSSIYRLTYGAVMQANRQYHLGWIDSFAQWIDYETRETHGWDWGF